MFLKLFKTLNGYWRNHGLHRPRRESDYATLVTFPVHTSVCPSLFLFSLQVFVPKLVGPNLSVPFEAIRVYLYKTWKDGP